MQHCSMCGEMKSLDQFHRRGEAGRQGACIPCRKKYDSERYQTNKAHHKNLVKLGKLARKEWAWALKDGPCTDCGGVFPPYVMQWDHVIAGKVENVSTMVQRGWSREKVLTEISKCELVCANCHAIRTHERAVMPL